MVKVSMLSTGEEVLHGDIVDTNASWLSELFFQQGFALHSRSTVGDKLDDLVAEITRLSHSHDVVIVNGGLGPTSDDMSAQAMALAAGVELELHQGWVEVMQAYFAKSNRPMAQSNLKQAMLPQGSHMINNPVGTACGFCMELNQALIVFTPGVPFEFKRMVQDEILPLLQQRFPQVTRFNCDKIYTFGLGESGIADLLQGLELPAQFEIGYRSYLPFIEVKLFSPQGHSHTQSILDRISVCLQGFVLSINQPLIEVVGLLLQQQQADLALLEQTTGGELSRQLYQDELAQGHFLQSMVDNQAIELEEFDDSLLLAQQYHQDCGAAISLANFRMQDGSVAVILTNSAGQWGQNVLFKRQYPLKAQQTLVAVLSLDMLRRQIQQKSVWGEYAHFERLAQQQVVF